MADELTPTPNAEGGEPLQPQGGEPTGVPGEPIEPPGEEDYKGKYEKLSSDIGRQGNELGELRRRLQHYEQFVGQLSTAMPGQGQQPTQPPPDSRQVLDQWLENPNKFLQDFWKEQWQKTGGNMEQNLQSIQQQQHILSFKISHPDYAKYLPAMQKILDANSGLTQYPDWLEQVYERAKMEEMKSGYEQSQKDTFEEGQKSVADREGLKDQAQTGGGKGGKKGKLGTVTSDMTTEEMEKVLPHAPEPHDRKIYG